MIIEHRRNIINQINDERKIKRKGFLILRSLEKRREYFTTILRQLPRIQTILEEKEKIKKDNFEKLRLNETYEEFKTSEAYSKYLKAYHRTKMNESTRDFCEYNIMKYRTSKYQVETKLEFESIKGRI